VNKLARLIILFCATVSTVRLGPQATPKADAPNVTPTSGVTRSSFGTVSGQNVEMFTLRNAHGVEVKATSYGAIITSIVTPDRNGRPGDIVLGFDTIEGYLKDSPYFGAVVGRYGNRIAKGRFTLDGHTYTLATNNGPNHLHGGLKGFDKVVWKAELLQGKTGVAFSRRSPDGEEGYPGTVTAKTVYTLTNDDELKVEMQATTDKTTLVNMAHHSYWNLGGYNSGTILDHELTLHADQYTPGTPIVPDGRVLPVKGTPFDFTSAKAIGKELKQVGGSPIGYDHNFVVNGVPNQLRPVGRLKDPKSGRVMTVSADQPGVQFYTGNFLDGSVSGKGATYVQYAALCLETQKFPNAINVPSWQDQVIIRPGEVYRHVMIHKFSAEP